VIQVNDGVQMILNDESTNAPGDYAIMRIKVGLVKGPRVQVQAEGWELAGFGYTTKTRETGDHVCLVYRFAGLP
jgi:hypothetical protein